MTIHDEIKILLAASCGGDLDAADQKRVEAHCAECAECRETLAELHLTLRLIRDVPEVDAPAWLTPKIMAQIRSHQEEQRSWLERLFLPLHIKLPLEALALLVVCVSGYYMARTVEPELRSAAVSREAAAPARDVATPQSAPEAEQPLAPVTRGVPPTIRQVPVLGSGNGAKMDQAAQSSDAHDFAQKSIPLQREAAAPLTVPAAPPPSVAKQERSSVAHEAASSDSVASAPVAGVKAAKKAKSLADTVASGRIEVVAPAALNAAAGAAAPPQQVTVAITLKISPVAAPEAVSSALKQSGATNVEDQLPGQRAITARLPASRMTELLERLARFATVAPVAQLRSSNGMLTLKITW